MLTLHSALKETLLPGLVAAAFIQAHSEISKSFLGLVCCFSCGLRGFEGCSFLCVWISIVIKVTLRVANSTPALCGSQTAIVLEWSGGSYAAFGVGELYKETNLHEEYHFL